MTAHNSSFSKNIIAQALLAGIAISGSYIAGKVIQWSGEMRATHADLSNDPLQNYLMLCDQSIRPENAAFCEQYKLIFGQLKS